MSKPSSEKTSTSEIQQRHTDLGVAIMAGLGVLRGHLRCAEVAVNALPPNALHNGGKNAVAGVRARVHECYELVTKAQQSVHEVYGVGGEPMSTPTQEGGHPVPAAEPPRPPHTDPIGVLFKARHLQHRGGGR